MGASASVGVLNEAQIADIIRNIGPPYEQYADNFIREKVTKEVLLATKSDTDLALLLEKLGVPADALDERKTLGDRLRALIDAARPIVIHSYSAADDSLGSDSPQSKKLPSQKTTSTVQNALSSDEPCVVSESTLLEGHSKAISGLAAMGGDYLISSSWDMNIHVWNTKTGICAKSWTAHEGYINSVVVVGSTKIVSGGDDRCIKVWDSLGFNWLTIKEAHEDSVLRLAALPDGNIVSGGHDSDMKIKVWDLQTGQCNMVLEGHTDRIYSLACLTSGMIASGGGTGDKTIRIWQISDPMWSISVGEREPVSNEENRCTKVLRGHTDYIRAIVQLPNGYIASAGGDSTVRIWDIGLTALAGKECVMVLSGHEDCVSCLCVIPGAVTVATGDGGKVTAYNILASGSDDMTIRMWNAADGTCMQVFRGHKKSVSRLAALPDRHILASGGRDSQVRLWGI